MTRKKLTIHEFARLVGVSSSTVSKALNGSGRMSEDTRKRILDAAVQYDYRPSLVAANLRASKTRTVGVIVPDIGMNVFSAVVKELEMYAAERGYNVILCTTGGSLAREKQYTQMLFQRRVEGVIAIPYAERANHDCSHFRDLDRQGVPVVIAEQNVPGAGLPMVVVDNYEGAQTITSHLISQGHRKIIYVASSLKDWDYAGRERFKGYRQALADNGIVYDDKLVIHTDTNYWDDIAQLLGANDAPTAVLAICDGVALSLISRLHRLGIEVPHDVSVAGFDDIPVSAEFIPALTTMHQPMAALGKRAAEILFSRIENPKSEMSELVHEKISCELVVRDSCRNILD